MNLVRAALRRLSGRGEVRLALVVRKDARLTSGGVARHCAEAAVNAYKRAAETPRLLSKWEAVGTPKLVFKVENVEEMKTLWQKANELNILTSFSYDENGNEPTVVGFGPNDKETLNAITKKLKLL